MQFKVFFQKKANLFFIHKEYSNFVRKNTLKTMLKRFLLILVSGYLIACESQNSSQNTSSKPTNEKIKQEETQKITPQETSNSEKIQQKIDTSIYEKFEVNLTFNEDDSIPRHEKAIYGIRKDVLVESKEKDILYYYNRLPRVFLMYPKNEILFDNKSHLKLIQYKNLKNGYLKCESYSKAEEHNQKQYAIINYEIEMALFMTKNNEVIVAINTMNLSNTDAISFLKLDTKKNIWYEITADIFPKRKCIPPCGGRTPRYFKLPEYGTTIMSIYDGNYLLSSDEIKNIWNKDKYEPRYMLDYLDWQVDKGKFIERK